MQTTQILTGELQLGQTLNHCVRDGKKSEFDLLLSMLSTDVCDQDQFAINNDDSTSTTNPIDCEDALKLQFSVPNSQTLMADSVTEAQYSLSLSKTALNEGLVAARLHHCLHQDALSFNVGKHHGIEADVFESLSPATVQRFTQQKKVQHKATLDFDDLIAAQKSYQAQLMTV